MTVERFLELTKLTNAYIELEDYDKLKDIYLELEEDKEPLPNQSEFFVVVVPKWFWDKYYDNK